ncbi:MAG: ribulose-phosphate 3-epimerase [Firmicutes bacterium]|nr:ribulose-phosphate 3-epimerase [Bacillota bacterium]
MKVAPSILSADCAQLGRDIFKVGNADLIHIDVMDGRFVPNISVGPGMIQGLRGITSVPFDVHLMIVEPERHLERFAEAGAEILSVHSEACVHLHRVVQRIRQLGCVPGVALNPATPPESLEFVLDQLDLVLVMTVDPGFGGQQFLHTMLPKISRLSEMRDRQAAAFEIEVDGGIDLETAGLAAQAGADILVAGTAVFRSADPSQQVELLRAARRPG